MINEEIFGGVDFPYQGAEVFQGSKIQGWAFSSLGVEIIIEIYVDNKLNWTTKTGIPRLDILQLYPNFKNSGYFSGFISKLSLTNFNAGRHQLRVMAKTKNSSRLIGQNTFILNEQTRETFLDNGLTKNFRTKGQLTFNLINETCELEPNYHILDLGCQLGRLAVPLTGFLNKNGKYEGLDIMGEAINWCKINITPKFPNFIFQLSDVYNGWYNPSGKFQSHEYKLPYDDETFDFVILISIFTHMLPQEVEHYFSEISRVLKRNGKCWISYCLLDKESLELLEQNKTTKKFVHKFDVFRSIDKERPERSIAYDKKFIINLYEKNGFNVLDPILTGNWRGENRDKPLVQDIIIAQKK